MSQPSTSQPSSPEVPDVVHAGVRYVQDTHDSRQGDQSGGYLAAIDAGSGRRLWRIAVYEVPAQPPDHPSVAIYFRSMRLAPDARSLEIVNTAGSVYRVDLASRQSARVGGPAAVPAAPPPPAKLPPG